MMLPVIISGALYNLAHFVKVERIAPNNYTIIFSGGVQATNVTLAKIKELFPDLF
jgi:hypothetical protein